MTRAAIYARFSSSRQREESIEDQVRVCREYAKAHGIDIVATYTDEAKSGTEADHRPGFQRMVADAGKGSFDALIVYKVDRFARNRYDSATYKAKLKRAGVELLSATEGVPDGPEGIILEAVLEGMAEYYSANLSQNIRRGIRGNALKCRHNGQKIFGYSLGLDGRYHPDPETAPAVEAAYRAAASGSTMAEIARELNGAGHRTVRGSAWNVKSVGRLLRNPRYRGLYSYAGVEVEGGMPAIVTRDLWDAAVARAGSTGGRRSGAQEAAYLLSGIFYDDEGQHMTPNCARSHTGAMHYYYRCRESGRSIRRDEADGRVRRAAGGLFADASMDDAIVAAVMACQDDLLADEFAAIDAAGRRIDEAEREQENLIELAAKTGASDRIARRINELDAEAAALRAELDEMRRGVPVVEADQVRFFLHKLRMCSAPDAVVRGFVSRTILHDGGEIEVQFLLDDLLLPVKNNKPAGEPAGLADWLVVETKGIEPSASAMRRQRSPS